MDLALQVRFVVVLKLIFFVVKWQACRIIPFSSFFPFCLSLDYGHLFFPVPMKLEPKEDLLKSNL